MLGATDWSNLTVAGAFTLGAALAAIATIRIMRAVVTMLDGPERRPRRRPWSREDDDDTVA